MNNETPLTPHSKAPWSANVRGEIFDADGTIIAQTFDNPDDGTRSLGDEISDHNTALILKAPELLAENAKLKADLAAEVEAHAKSVQQHVDYVAGKITLEDIQVQNGTLNIKTSTEMVRIFAAHFRLLLDHHKAVNYFEMVFGKAGSAEQILVTIKRHEGKTPHELRVETERKLVKCRDAAASLAWNLAFVQINGHLSDMQRNAIKNWETLQAEL